MRTSEEDILLEQIQGSLDEIDVENWELHGRTLNTDESFPKPRDTWEKVYTTKLKDSSLVLRHSQSVTSKYTGSSYMLRPTGFPRFTVELRAREFSGRELTEPGRVKCQDTRLEVLADGETARKLFEYLDKRYQGEARLKRQIFDREIEKLLDSLPQLIEQQTLSDVWTREEDEFGGATFRSFQNSFDIEAKKIINDSIEEYELRISRSPFDFEDKDLDRPEHIFELLEKMRKVKGLVAIHEALDQVEAA